MQKVSSKILILFGFVFIFIGFIILDPSYVSAQSCNYNVSSEESPPCYESAPYPTSCNGVNSTFCATNYGTIICKQQFKDVRNRNLLQTTPVNQCPAIYDPASCTNAPQKTIPLGYIACQGAGACGNGVKEVGECCDTGGPTSSCDNTCSCTSGVGTCGDGVCRGEETSSSCPQDCNPTQECPFGAGMCTCPVQPFNITYSGPSAVTIYQGDSTSVGVRMYNNGAVGLQNATFYTSCIEGATCTPTQSSQGSISSSNTEDGYGIININTSSATAPGTYSMPVRVVSTNNAGCDMNISYTVTVKPSRKVVCDGAWYDIPPGAMGFGINSGPLNLYNNGATNSTKYFKATYNGRYPTQVNQTTWGDSNFSTKCVYENGLSDTCTWALPVNMPNTGTGGYAAVSGWSMDTTGPYGTGVTASDTATSPRTMELRRSGSTFQYKCTVPSPNTAVCDGGWRYLPDRGATIYQPTGTYVSSAIDSQYKDAIFMAVGGSQVDTSAYIQSCKFNGTNNCTFESGWTNLGAITRNPLNLSLGSALEVNLKTTWAGGERVNNINRSTGWAGWGNTAADNGTSWGQPFRTVDKIGRYWQFRNINGGVAYACGASPVCVALNYSSTKSSVSKTSLSGNEAFTVKCDYGVKGIQDALSVTSGGGATCSFANWDSAVPTTAVFNCTAGTVSGTYSLACNNSAGTASNVCAQTNTLTNISVTNVAATADINANPLSVPYNSPSTITWSSSNATSCTVSPTGWTGTSGSQSSGNLTTSRTYSLDCLPSGPNSSDTVTVNVQAAQTFTLNVIRSGQGTVTSNPVGINCGADCNESYVQNTSVTLTATPSSGRIFTGWGGACSGKGTCTVVINSSKTVYANFAVDPNFKEF